MKATMISLMLVTLLSCQEVPPPPQQMMIPYEVSLASTEAPEWDGPDWANPEHPQQVLLFCVPGCDPCDKAKAKWVPWLTKANWRVQVFEYSDETAHIYEQYGINEGPTWVVLEHGVEELRWSGILRLDMLDYMNYVYENSL